jgi:hypothetical protein
MVPLVDTYWRGGLDEPGVLERKKGEKKKKINNSQEEGDFLIGTNYW